MNSDNQIFSISVGQTSFSVAFVPFPKFKGRRNGYFLENKVYLCPVLHAYLLDPQTHHQALAGLTIIDVKAYFSPATAQRMKAEIEAHLLDINAHLIQTTPRNKNP